MKRLLEEDVKAAFKQLAEHLNNIAEGEEKLPVYASDGSIIDADGHPTTDCLHTSAFHLDKKNGENGEKIGDVWIVGLLIVTTDPKRHADFLNQARLFMKQKGDKVHEIFETYKKPDK